MEGGIKDIRNLKYGWSKEFMELVLDIVLFFEVGKRVGYVG